ncbi:LysM peptidoglycan-binding domain-containing protein [Paenibacillus sp. TRM 82003]|nr:LysM peptidoglycan-binding domain-containing protein [Paenibacillus sp. TRM 82003]
MSQQPSGLRFDIYERVHLPENTAGIRELNGIELTPEISVIAQGEQAVLKGYLSLAGTYAGEDENRAEEELSHRIPVEITLPLSRVENVDNIRVEIENFDVDVLSPRSLNVTGVLSLEGIEMATAAEAEWREEEEVVFSHRVEQPAPPAPATTTQAAATPEPTPEPPPAPIAAFSAETPPPAPPAPVPNPQLIQAAENEAAENEAIAAAEINGEPDANPVAAIEEADENAAAPNAPAEQLAEALEETKPPEKQEIKIAFSGKTAEAPAAAPIGVNSILSMANAGAAAHPPAEKRVEAAAAETADSSEGRDRLEWKKLFLQSTNDEPSFRKVRMCIAQKEDTIETIADRYKKNARELALYNRLNADYLQEGQVVYIP